ncbi:MAG: Holliday junction DNA helicase RuvB C-terminal domain-containing protein, partial [Patescibacteria group bacterium]
RASAILKIPLDKNAAKEIAIRSRRTPRIANRILKRANDLLLVDNHKTISLEMLKNLFKLLELDEYGLSDIDRKYLDIVGKKFQNKAIGVETIASALTEDKRTIEEFIEPYLLQIGFIKKTPKGRVLTTKALSHIGLRGHQEPLL